MVGYATLSLKYGEQIAQALRLADLIRSKRGRYGGYMLARPPDEITMMSIIEAVDGEIMRDRPEMCQASQNVNARLHTIISKFLCGYTLDEKVVPFRKTR